MNSLHSIDAEESFRYILKMDEDLRPGLSDEMIEKMAYEMRQEQVSGYNICCQSPIYCFFRTIDYYMLGVSL